MYVYCPGFRGLWCARHRIALLAVEAGVPPGVLNLSTGEGSTVGATIAESLEVDALVFAGSGPTGRRLLDAAARSNIKRVYLELGGKSPNIIFAETADLDAAAKTLAQTIFRNAGQACIASARLLVQRDIHDDFIERLKSATEAMRLGAGVWTSDQGRAHRMVRAIRAGVVHVNTYGGSDVTVPLGGVKQSDNGYDKSLHSFDKYLNLKTAWIKL